VGSRWIRKCCGTCAFGVSARSTSYLLTAGWLQRLSKGAYLLRGDKLTREGILAFIARKIPGLHVGGRSTLIWHTSATLPSTERLVLWGPRPYKFPPWVAEHPEFSYQTTDLFDGNLPYGTGLSVTESDPCIPVSVPERALLELVSDAGKILATEELVRCVPMAHELRETVLDEFLSHCSRVKVIRLVRDLAQFAGRAWAGTAQYHVDRLGADKRWSYLSRNGERLTLK